MAENGNALQQLKEIIGSDLPGLAEHILKLLADELAERILKLHAHELAERIRQAAAGDPGTGLCPQISTARNAANLIDPEVQR